MANQSYSVLIGASGTGTITITTGRQVEWTVTQVSVEITSTNTGTTCVLRKNGSLITPLVPSGDAATGDPPVSLWPTDQLTVTWTGAPVGAVARAYIFYEESAYQ